MRGVRASGARSGVCNTVAANQEGTHAPGFVEHQISPRFADIDGRISGRLCDGLVGYIALGSY